MDTTAPTKAVALDRLPDTYPRPTSKALLRPVRHHLGHSTVARSRLPT